MRKYAAELIGNYTLVFCVSGKAQINYGCCIQLCSSSKIAIGVSSGQMDPLPVQ
jgi:hypothetical protein